VEVLACRIVVFMGCKMNYFDKNLIEKKENNSVKSHPQDTTALSHCVFKWNTSVTGHKHLTELLLLASPLPVSNVRGFGLPPGCSEIFALLSFDTALVGSCLLTFFGLGLFNP
jgi:hypothetical protein